MHLLQLLEICPLQGGASPQAEKMALCQERSRGRVTNAPEQIHLHSSDGGDICDSQPWLLFGVTTFKAVIKINIDDN